MWKRFYLLRSSMTGFGLQLRVHFPKSIKGEKKRKKKVVMEIKRIYHAKCYS